jgi:hypothetical protein
MRNIDELPLRPIQRTILRLASQDFSEARRARFYEDVAKRFQYARNPPLNETVRRAASAARKGA